MSFRNTITWEKAARRAIARRTRAIWRLTEKMSTWKRAPLTSTVRQRFQWIPSAFLWLGKFQISGELFLSILFCILRKALSNFLEIRSDGFLEMNKESLEREFERLRGSEIYWDIKIFQIFTAQEFFAFPQKNFWNFMKTMQSLKKMF